MIIQSKEIEWRRLPSTKYLISNYGAVRHIDRKKEQKPEITKDGYHAYTIHKKKISAHRLVAMVFIEKFNTSLVVNHIDFCRTNNFVENLEMCTVKENANHSALAGRYKRSGESNNNCKYDDIIVLTIKTMIGAGVGDTEISRKYKIPRKYINDIKLGKIRNGN